MIRFQVRVSFVLLSIPISRRSQRSYYKENALKFLHSNSNRVIHTIEFDVSVQSRAKRENLAKVINMLNIRSFSQLDQLCKCVEIQSILHHLQFSNLFFSSSSSHLNKIEWGNRNAKGQLFCTNRKTSMQELVFVFYFCLMQSVIR